jgi:hypothetical protein
LDVLLTALLIVLIALDSTSTLTYGTLRVYQHNIGNATSKNKEITVTRRKHISWKTRCAAALLSTFQCRNMYDDAKQMTEDQFLSLFHWDHNILHSTEHEDRDRFWNLTPMLILAHREKTKTDAKIVAKSRRIRAKAHSPEWLKQHGFTNGLWRLEERKRTLRSRGFDKTLRKKLDGTVVKRER